MALNCRDAESDGHIALMLKEHACLPFDREIERIEFLLPSCACRRRQAAARQ